MGRCVNEYSIQVRILNAISIFENSNAAVSETICQVGFKSSSYFSRDFKSCFVVSSVNVKKRGLKNNTDTPIIDLNPKQSKNRHSNKVIYKQKKRMLFTIALCFCLGFEMIISLSFSIQKLIAVLPLPNLTGHVQNDCFVDGMHESPLCGLVQFGSNYVIYKIFTLRYRDGHMLLKDITKDVFVAMIKYNVFSLATRFEAHGSMGGLSDAVKDSVMKLTISH